MVFYAIQLSEQLQKLPIYSYQSGHQTPEKVVEESTASNRGVAKAKGFLKKIELHLSLQRYEQSNKVDY